MRTYEKANGEVNNLGIDERLMMTEEEKLKHK